MKRYVWMLIVLSSSACLKDGRSEAEYLADYARFVDLDVPDTGGTDQGEPSGGVEVLSAESDLCSSPRPADTFFVDVRNTGGVAAQIHLVDETCAESFQKQAHIGSRATLDGWPDAVYRARDADGNFLFDLVVHGPIDGELEVP